MHKSNPTLCFYGDDFTGSTDALDALASAGIEAALLLDPSVEILDMVPDVAAIGIAGMSRAMTPEEMAGELPRAFDFLATLNPKIIHYKVCSTFDSSPSKGNIGKAIEIGQQSFGSRSIPVIVGSPALGRYVAFGNLFARAGGIEVHRIDRHPVMSRHPITPMLEADLRLHLAKQTALPIDLVALTDIDAGKMPSVDERDHVILFDTTTAAHLQHIGRWLIGSSREKTVFCVGSSAVETAIAPQLRSAPIDSKIHRIASGERPVAIVSGSCSPITARQIDVAIGHGFSPIHIPAMRFADDRSAMAAHHEAVSAACAELERGNSPIIFSAHGAGDLDTTIDPSTRSSIERQIGERLGVILRAIVEQAKLGKIIVAGGDTSGSVTRALGLSVLQVASPITPGAPLCLGTRRDRSQVEIALKGGQMGGDDFFLRARAA